MSDQKLHPVIMAAAGAVIIACGVAAAHFAGWIGGPKAEDTAALTASVPAVAVASPVPVVAVASVPTAAPVAAAEPVKTASTKHHTGQRATARNEGTQYNNEPAQPAAQVCASCGHVTSVQAIAHEGSGSGVGAVGGGVVGGLLGHQIGNGNGRTLATVAGALGGALAGNTVEKHVRTTTDYVVHVAFDDGSSRSFNYKEKPEFNSGDRVRANGDTLLLN